MPEPILIAMYNFKGGVGKTTATYNLGYMLQNLGLRVLMVDADPQANLTALVWPEKYNFPLCTLQLVSAADLNNIELDPAIIYLNTANPTQVEYRVLGANGPERGILKLPPDLRPINAANLEERKSFVLTELLERGHLPDRPLEIQSFYAEAERKSEQQPPQYTTIGTLFNSVLQGNMPPANLDAAKGIELVEVLDYKNLYLLPGACALGNLDHFVSLGVEGVSFSQNLPGYVSNIFRQIGREKKIDIILFDLNPGFGSFNGALIMGADYFLIPAAADFFSFQALISLQEKMPEWYRNIHKRDRERNPEFGLIRTTPKFLGVFPQRIRVRKKPHSEHYAVEQAYQRWVSTIYQETRKLETVLGTIPTDTQPSAPTVSMLSGNYQHFTCTGIVDFVGSGLEAQDSGRPMADVSYRHRHSTGEKFRDKEIQRKNWVYDAYLDLIVKAFSNFSGEHIASFPRFFRQELALTRNIGIDLEAGYVGQAPQTPAPFFDSEEEGPLNNRATAPYEDSQIKELLEYYRRRSECTDYVIMQSPISAERTALVEVLETSKSDIQKLDIEKVQALVFIPINLGERNRQGRWQDNHWVLLSLHFTRCSEQGNFEIDTVTYFDPLGVAGNIQAPNSVVASLRDAGLEDLSIRVTSARVQDEKSNSGAWLIEHVRSVIDLIPMPSPGTREIYDRRQEHGRILRQEAGVERQDMVTSTSQASHASQRNLQAGNSSSSSQAILQASSNLPSPKIISRRNRSSSSSQVIPQANSSSSSFQAIPWISSSSSSSQARPRVSSSSSSSQTTSQVSRSSSSSQARAQLSSSSSSSQAIPQASSNSPSSFFPLVTAGTKRTREEVTPDKNAVGPASKRLNSDG